MKQTFAIILFTLTMVSATAQEKKEWNQWTVTPRVGVTLSSFAGELTYGQEYYRLTEDDFSFGASIGFGAEVEYKSWKSMGISLGVFYEQQNAIAKQLSMANALDYAGGFIDHLYWNFPENEVDQPLEQVCARVDYLKRRTYQQRQLIIPLMVNYHVWKGLTVKAGLEYSRLLGGHEKHDYLVSELASGEVSDYKFEYYVYSPITWDREKERWLLDPETYIYTPGPKRQYQKSESTKEMYKMYRNNLSVPFAIAYEYKNLELEARYHWGLTRLFRTKYSYGKTTNNSFLITLGYRFEL